MAKRETVGERHRDRERESLLHVCLTLNGSRVKVNLLESNESILLMEK